MDKLWSLLLVGMLVLSSPDAEARRMGGGKSMGRQSSNVTQREAAPSTAPGSNQAAPAQSAAAKPAAPAPGAAPAPKKPWGAMLGGLAAGLGLAWLANSLGLGAAFGQFLLIALLVLAGFMLFGMFMRGRKPAGAAAASGSMALQGAGGASPVTAPMSRQYSPDKVGNDASARPWEHGAGAPEVRSSGAGAGVVIGSALAGTQNWGIPAGFDAEGFVAAAKRNFITLQAAWDRSDIPALRAMMTDGMLEEIKAQLNEREQQRGGQGSNQTDVLMLEAQLLGIEELDDAYLASVEFSGMIREEPSAGPNPFREVWNMTKPKAGGGWLVAGVQALQ